MPRIRPWLVAFGLLFHAGLALALDLGLFSFQMGVLLIGCLDDRFPCPGDRGCRRWHFAGTVLAGGCVALGLWLNPGWLLLASVLGYGCSWIGHFTCERNLPAAWHSPWLSLLGDLRMFRLTLLGRMDAEVERLTSAPREK